MDEVATRRPTHALGLSLRSVGPVMAVAALVLAAVTLRLLWDRFLDPFEDGYQNWWIASSLSETGRYADPFSQMTRGNWLPGYPFFTAGLVALFGTHIMPLLKAANIVFSLGTTAIVYHIARPRGRVTAALAATLFALSPADIVISSFATPEALTLLTTFSGVYLVDRRPLGAHRSVWVAAFCFLGAATLRYEVWGFVGIYLLGTWRTKLITRRELIVLAAPVALFAAGWWAWTSQYGFFPAMIVSQTSTDVRYKESVGVLSPLTERLASFFGWYLAWTPFAVVAIAWAALRERRSLFTYIFGFFYGAEILYTAAGFGNPGPRYIHLTVPIVCIYAATAAVAAGARLTRLPRTHRATIHWAPIAGAVLAALVLSAQVVNPSPPPGFLLSGMQRAGVFLSSLPLPDDKILISESPIAAYYSGYPPSRIFGSSDLSEDPSNASVFITENAAYVVLVTVPYYRLRTLFPDQANGINGNHLILIYDATGVEYEYGAPRVLVFNVTA